MQYTVGFISFLFPGVKHSLRRSILPYHSYIGLLLTVLPTITICLGLLEKTTFMQIAASKSQSADIAHGRWLANTAGLLALAGMAAVLYVLVSGGRAVRSNQDGVGREAERMEHGEEEEEAAEEEEEAVAAGAGEGEQVEGRRSVFDVPVPYPSETSSLLQSADEGKRVNESLRGAEDVAPPASFATYVDEMLDKHFSRRASREGHTQTVAVRVEEYGSSAQYRREPDRQSGQSGRSSSASASSVGHKRNSSTAGERVEQSSRSRIETEQQSPTSPESMWPRFKGVGANGVILQSP